MAQETTFINLSASGQVIAGEGVICSMYVNSTSSGTVKLYNALVGSGSLINNTITPAIGFHNLGNIRVSLGCYASIAGTLDVTFHVKRAD